MLHCLITVGLTLMPLSKEVVETLNVFDVFIKDFLIHIHGDILFHCCEICAGVAPGGLLLLFNIDYLKFTM